MTDKEQRDLVQQQTPSNARSMTRVEAIETDMDPDRAVERILEAGAALDRLTVAALGMTDARCWDNMQGRPRLNAYGAHQVAKKVGIRVRTFGSHEVESGQDDGGPYFVFQCTGEVSHPLSPAIIPCQGTCDSRNKFHTTRYEEVLDEKGNLIWEEKEFFDKARGRKIKKRLPKREKIQLQAHQVQRSFIAQQAMTLCKTKGITEYLGLDRLTWPEVEKYTQAAQEDAADVRFKNRAPEKQDQKKKRESPPPAPETSPRDALATKNHRSTVWKAFVERMGWNDDSLPSDAPAQFYGFVEGTVGTRYRDKKTWTVGVIDDLLKAMVEAPSPDEPPPPTDDDRLPEDGEE